MHNRTGLLVVRVWLEGKPDDGGLRARITHTLNVADGAEVVTAAAATEEIFNAVRDWLEAYLAS